MDCDGKAAKTVGVDDVMLCRYMMLYVCYSYWLTILPNIYSDKCIYTQVQLVRVIVVVIVVEIVIAYMIEVIALYLYQAAN